MKFFIFMCCTGHLLTGISSRIRRTTPMPSTLRSNDAEARRVMKFAEIIDFVNSVSDNDDRRSSFRRHGPSKRQDSRRLNEVMAVLDRFADLKKFYDVDTRAAAREIEDKVRYHIIDDPDVLLAHRTNPENNTKGKKDQESVPFDPYQFSTAKAELSEGNRRAQKDVEELTIDETSYRPSFPDDEDDDKPITDGIELTNNEKEKNKPKIQVEDLPPEINKSDEFEKRTQNNISSSKEDKAQIDKKKAVTKGSKEAGTKTKDNKEFRSTKFIYSQEKLNEDCIRPKNDDDKINKEDGATNKNSGLDKKVKERSRDQNENNLTSIERLFFKVDSKINDNRDYKEQYSIYSHKERRENSNTHSKKTHKKKDRYDKKKKDEYHDKRGERESQWIKVDNQNYYKESLRDKNNEKLSQKERDWDSNHDKRNKKGKKLDNNHDRGSKTEKKWDDDDKWSKKEKDWGEIDERWNNKQKALVKTDERWTKKEKYWNNKKPDYDKDKGFDTMEYEWNKRHQEYDKHEDDGQWEYSDSERNEKNFKERDNEYKKRDSEFNNRDNDWTKRDNGGNKNIGRTYDRNESGNKKSYESVDNDRDVRHDRYKIVDRVDSDSSRYDDYERAF